MKQNWMRGFTAKSVVGALSLLPMTVAVAQEEVVETAVESRTASIVMSTDQEGGPPQGIVVMSAESSGGGGAPVVSGFSFNSADGTMFSLSGEMSGMGDGPTGFRFGTDLPMFDANNWGSLLNVPEIRQELDIMDAQMEQITKARTEMEKGIKEQVSKIMEGGFDPSKAKEMAEMIRSQRSAIDEQISEQLLPAQVQRLKEVALRMQMKQVGTVGLLGRKDIMEALGLSDAELEALKKKAAELDAEMKKRVEEFKKKAHAELLNELNPDQRKKLEGMLGNEFDYQAPERTRGMRNRNVSPPATPATPAFPAFPATPTPPASRDSGRDSGAGTTNRFELRSGGR